MQMMTPTAHEKAEWSRLAQAAYGIMRNDVGHAYSVAASLPRDGQISTARFTALMTGYCDWLVFDQFPTDEAVR